MHGGIEKFENFFKRDLEMKMMLQKLFPTTDKGYDGESVIKYNEELTNSLEIMEYYIVRTMTEFDNFFSYIPDIKKKFQEFRKQIETCFDYKKLSGYYTKIFADMDPGYINEINSEVFGYYLFSKSGLINKAATINEMFHFIHHYITNTEHYYNQIPKLGQKMLANEEAITLYGKENEYSKKLFEQIPLDLNCGMTDIMSLSNNKIIMLIRDKGHALSIEIDISDDMCLVNYFIPKVCNVDIVNSLKGVNPVNENSKFTTGQFHTDKVNLIKNIYDFIAKVPGDAEMFIEGGKYYDAGKIK